MDGQDYLNQLAASTRPNQKPKNNNFLSSPIFKVLAIGLLALIAIIIAGSALSSGSSNTKSESILLKYHIDNTLEVISKYQPNVKSSDLRSSSVSLKSVLSNTIRELTDFITETYNPKDIEKKYKEEIEDAALKRDALDSSLFDAKINGILDQIYTNKLTYVFPQLWPRNLPSITQPTTKLSYLFFLLHTQASTLFYQASKTQTLPLINLIILPLSPNALHQAVLGLPMMASPSLNLPHYHSSGKPLHHGYFLHLLVS